MQRVPCLSLAPRQVHVYEEPLPIAGQKAPWAYVQPNGTMLCSENTLYGGIGLSRCAWPRMGARPLVQLYPR